MAIVARPAWTNSSNTHVWVFNIGRGLCIFIRTPLNQGIMYDCGCSPDFDPSILLKEHILPYLDSYEGFPLAQVVFSHPHADHIAGIRWFTDPDIDSSPFRPRLITCPHDKRTETGPPEALNWKRIENPEWSLDEIEIYKELIKGRHLPLQTIRFRSPRYTYTALEYGLYYLRPPVVNSIFPTNNQEYANGLSLILYYRHGLSTILIPGDINPEPLRRILLEMEGHEKRYTMFNKDQLGDLHRNFHWHDQTTNQPSLRSLLSGDRGLTVLVAPHHGLRSCFSEDLYACIKGGKPGLVVISESRKARENHGEVDGRYQGKDGAEGRYILIDGSSDYSHSVSTKNGHHMLLVLHGTDTQPGVYLEKNPVDLLKHLQ